MAGFALASVLSWTILLGKTAELLAASRSLRRALALAESGVPEPASTPRALRLMRDAVQRELTASSGAPSGGTKARLATRLDRIERHLVRQARRGTGWLATIGSTAPSVGLFGTVWGIMNSFVGIARLHTIYNLFARWVGGYSASVGDLGETVLRHASRLLGRPSLSLPPRAGPHSRLGSTRSPLTPHDTSATRRTRNGEDGRAWWFCTL